ncbi:MAG: lamin tail domain-containing protein [Bacteroidota bacterium]
MKKSLLILFALFLGAGLFAQECSELFISEYVEGSGNNKAIEIYNPTEAAIDLSGYNLVRYSNGSPLPNLVGLSGTIESKGTFVVVLDKRVEGGTGQEIPVDPALQAKADLFLCPVYTVNKMMYFNGNDAVTLETVTGTIVDIFAIIGPPDTDNGWTNFSDTTITWNNGGTPEDYTIVNYGVGPLFWLAWTKDHTLIRKYEVEEGVVENPNPAFIVGQQWDSIPENTFDSLGFHNCNCNTSAINEIKVNVNVEVFPNPVIDNSFTVEATEPITSITMFDLTGRVSERIVGSGSYTQNVVLDSKFSGFLFITINFENGKAQTRKLLFK